MAGSPYYEPLEAKGRLPIRLNLYVGAKNLLPGNVIVGPGMKDEWKSRMNPKATVNLGEIHDRENRQISRIFKMADVFASRAT